MSHPSPQVARVVAAYDDWRVRLYGAIRFHIINPRILERVESRVAASGTTLDLGCGFGLFSLYFAVCGAGRRLVSVDLDPARIAVAERAARKLGLADRVRFTHQDVLAHEIEGGYASIVLIDLLHHLPVPEMERTLVRLFAGLRPGGVLIVKDVDAEPWPKVLFTWTLDKLMYPRAPVAYQPRAALRARLERLGFAVELEVLPDYLPYPHVLYVCRKPG